MSSILFGRGMSAVVNTAVVAIRAVVDRSVTIVGLVAKKRKE